MIQCGGTSTEIQDTFEAFTPELFNKGREEKANSQRKKLIIPEHTRFSLLFIAKSHQAQDWFR